MVGSNWIDSTMRIVVSSIDKVIYGFISDIYVLIVKLADVRIFDDATLGQFASRLYGLIAIFMAFKLIFTFVNYAVNPDTLTDAKTGGKKLITNIVVSLVLLIAVPGIIFPLSRDIQSAVLSENIIPAVILGTKSSPAGSDTMEKQNIRTGRMLSYSVMSAFFTIDSSICDNTNFYLANPQGSYGGQTAENDPSELENLVYKIEEDCRPKLVSAIDPSYGDAEIIVQNFERSYNQYSTKILLGGTDEYDLKLLKQSTGDYVFDYNLFLSTIAGGFVAWMLIVICFKIAVRTIKLAFLELVAPIPILSYIDEKSKSKSFNGWVKACISTYLDLFIRLAAVFFVTYVISQVSLNLTFENLDGSPGLLIKVFIIIGALMFVDQLPKLMQEIFGTSGDGGFSLNPLKGSKLASTVTKGVAIGGAAAIGGGVLSGISNYRGAQQRNRELNEQLQNPNLTNEERKKIEGQRMGIGQGYGAKNAFRGAGSIIAGMSSGAVRSGKAGAKSGKITTSVTSGVSTSSSLREQRFLGNGTYQRQRTKAADMMNVTIQDDGEFSAMKSRLKQMKREQADLQAAETSVEKARMDTYTKDTARYDTMFEKDTLKLKNELSGKTTEDAWTIYDRDYSRLNNEPNGQTAYKLTETEFKKFYDATVKKESLNELTNKKADEIKGLENRIDESKKLGGGK